MSKIDDGGFAYPVIPPVAQDGGCVSGYPFPEGGMSLRDWFAGKAISGALASDIDLESADWDNCAQYAYALADAMIKARGGPT